MNAVRQWNRRLFSLLLAVLLCAAALPEAFALAEEAPVNYTVEVLPEGPALRERAAHDASWYTEDAVYARLMAVRNEYPEGRHWTNSDFYQNTYLWYGGDWDGYYVRYTGYGCAGFVLIMSDAAFGSELPIWQDFDVRFSKLRVGDILRVNNDSHSVIVTKVNSNSVTVAEGNYNSSIHWGRTLSAAEVERADYILSRWPGFPKVYTVSYDANGGAGAPAAQSKLQGEALKLSGERPEKSGAFFLGWAESPYAAEAAYQPGGSFARDASTTLYAVWATPDLTLPESLTAIGDEAFRGGAFRFARLSEKTASVGSGAFADCRFLRCVYIPAATKSIDPDAFGELTGLTVFGKADSPAAAFARAHGFTFIAVS